MNTHVKSFFGPVYFIGDVFLNQDAMPYEE
jgi:hypothetical protein